VGTERHAAKKQIEEEQAGRETGEEQAERQRKGSAGGGS
jgi:hypothetical protein